MTFNTETFSSGNGKMTYDRFARYADDLGVDQAVWVAKYFGVALNVVRCFVRLYMKK